MIDGLLQSVYLERVGRELTHSAEWWKQARLRLIPRRYLLSARLVKRFVTR